MNIHFDKDYLRELYEKGKSRDKQHRYQPVVVKNYQKCVKILSTVLRIEDLFLFRSLRYEVLSGGKQGVSSVRINDQYRLEFIISTSDTSEEIVVTIYTLIDITNHYK
ncbi:MAG: type II toxin-antitoxin system RelE/ParE family toxin [Rikenellaceae bacterium]|jgi:proteic killer suppression protein|nr:type II toxin-antitoxin system RelE/ParE family toxin [Rikenellaceae bacterium]